MALTADQLNTIYNNVLFRNVDAGGIQFFANRTDISDAQVRQQIELSPEATTYVTPIVRLYQAEFGRVPDVGGLKFFVQSFEQGGGTQNISVIAQQLLNSAEATSGGTTAGNVLNAGFVSTIYNNILGRTASTGEVTFWTGSGKTAAVVLSEITNSNESAQRNASGVVTFLDSAAVGSPNGGSLNSQTGAGGGTSTGSTLVLTTGTDNLIGTTGNDTINGGLIDNTTAANTTLTAADTINGGAGTADILNVTITGTVPAVNSATNNATVTNVEGLQIRNAGDTNPVLFDANTAPGLTFINSLNSTGAVTVSNAANNTAFGDVGNGVTTNGALTAGYVNTATSARLTVANGTTAGAVTITGAALETLAITSLGANNTVGAIAVTPALKSVTIDATTALNTTGLTVGTLVAGGQTLTISGSAANQAATTAAFATPAVVLGTLDADFVTVNASGLTAGGISATLSNLTAVVTGGAGNDIIKTAGVLTGVGAVNAGGGLFDRLVLANTADLASTALGAKYTGFEQLQVEDGASANLDNIGGITGVLLNDGASNTTALTNLSAAQAASITVLASAGASIIDVKGAAIAGQIDTVGLIFTDGDTTLNEAATSSTFTLANIENLNVTAVDGATIVQSAAASGSLTNVTLSGAGNISFTTGNIATANFTINASTSTGTNTISAVDFATNGVSITGGTGIDTITGSAQIDNINSGAGNDIVTGGAGADRINVGAGTDTIIQGTGASGTYAAPVTNTISTTNFDVVTGLGVGDRIDLTDVVRAITASNTLVGTAPTDNAAVAIRGTYDGTANTFVGSATGTDTLFTYDTNVTVATVALEAIVLVGYVNTATASSDGTGIFTLA